MHIRKKYSSNRDLSALSGLTKGVKSYKVNLGGAEAESILRSSAKLPNILKLQIAAANFFRLFILLLYGGNDSFTIDILKTIDSVIRI